MSRPRVATDELREQVWRTLSKFKGDREQTAAALGKSLRTLNRYIADMDLYEDMEKAGFIQNAGPPRGAPPGTSNRQRAIVEHIKKNKGEIDYVELTEEMYGTFNDVTKQRTYTAISELKEKGVIANDGERWFVIK